MNPIDVLKAARALIERPEHWTTNTFARDITGSPVWSGSESATSWCAFGAIKRIAEFECEAPLTSEVASLIERYVQYDAGLSMWNDTHTHAEVLAGFDKAIAAAEEQGA